MGGVLIVTGASRGIGAATAKLAGARGWAVAVNYNASADRAEAVVAAIKKSGGKAVAIKADVSTAAGVKHLFAETDKQLGPVTGLFNNAGIVHAYTPISELTEKELNEHWRINITSQFLCAGEAVKRMSTKSGGRGGAIVNMSSRASMIGGANGMLAYAASKGAIDTFTKGLSIDGAPLGIRVNAVRPGLIETEIHDDTGDKDRLKKLVGLVPQGRVGTAEEVGETVLWLLSDAASYVTGALVDIGGGR
jgi:NAD(P)-dependent dehydrogenase (short-subunit alcohol dehydrogenase family)